MKERIPKNLEITHGDGLWWVWERDGNRRSPLQFAFKDHRDATELAADIAEHCGAEIENAPCAKSCKCVCSECGE